MIKKILAGALALVLAQGAAAFEPPSRPLGGANAEPWVDLTDMPPSEYEGAGSPFTPELVNLIHGVSYSPDYEAGASVLLISPDANARLLTGVPGYAYLQGYRAVGQMARAYTDRGHDVIAAINGGFFGLLSPPGVQLPMQGALIKNGELLRNWNPHSSNEYISQEHYIIGVLDCGALFHGFNPAHEMLLSVNGGEERALQGLNGARSAGRPNWPDLNLLTGRFGPYVPAPPERLEGTDVRLEVLAGRMSFGEQLIMRVAQAPRPAADVAKIGAGYAILTASSPECAAFLSALAPGDIISVRHELANRRGCGVDWARVDQAIPAHFKLISGGERLALPRQAGALVPEYPEITPNSSTGSPLPWLPGQIGRRPRTAVGLRADGTMVWVVVSGSWTTGMTMLEFQDYLMGLDLEYAWNFDGGGSAAMIIGETLVSYAAGAGFAYQRPVANGLVLVSYARHGPFIDVRPDSWYAGYASFAYERGLMQSTRANHMIFEPDALMTRAMLVSALYKHAGSPDITGLPNPFIDIGEGRWYADAVLWAAYHRIVLGVGGGRFAPSYNITREQMAAIMLRYAGAGLPALLEPAEFADAHAISAWAREAACAIQRAGIITGRPGNIFDPQGNTTRAESAAILRRFTEVS